MESALRNRVAWISGASGGIGRATARAFADEGALLLLQAGNHLSSLDEWVQSQGLADRALCVAADVRDAEAVDAALAAGTSRFGKIDICIANAGIWPVADLPLHEMPVSRIREVVDTNLLGVLHSARAFLRHLAELPRRDGSSLCLVGSTAGLFGERGHVEYAAAKAALVGVLGTLKNEVVHLDPYGRVNLVQPGWTATPMAELPLADAAGVRLALTTMPLRQLARAEDIARAIVFFSSPNLARHVSGQILTVAGGMEGRQQWPPEDIDVDAVRSRLAGED
jgi:3-oxoacyl-[acyl-carrier protein] reductase